MYLLLLTVFYCLFTQLIDMSYGPAMGIILLSIGFLKGYYSDSRRDLFNLRSTQELYEENGLTDTAFELLSLLFIYINSYLLGYETFTLFEFIFLFVGFALLYRYLFWGITRTFRENIRVPM